MPGKGLCDNQARDPGFGKPQWVREGIVAHSTVRIAAGAGVVAASLLIVGPNPADAVADGRGSGSRFENDDWTAQGGNAQRRASDGVNDVLNAGGADKTPKPDLNSPVMDLGTGGSGSEDLAMVESFAPEGQVALRSAAVAEEPAGDNVSVAATPGSGYSGQPVTAFRSPRVVVGNGRTPGTHVPRPGSAPDAVLVYDALVSPAAVPDVPVAIEINIPPLPPPLPPVERIGAAELVVGEFGTGTTDTVTDPLAGVAGLILIPAVGAVLGYRQARAAQSFRESLRT